MTPEVGSRVVVVARDGSPGRWYGFRGTVARVFLEESPDLVLLLVELEQYGFSVYLEPKHVEVI